MYKSYESEVKAKVKDIFFQTAKDGFQEILDASLQIVPIDDRELIDGATLSFQESGDKLEIVIAYGTDPVSAEYAVIQHENPYYNHAPGKQYKFLEQPFNQIAPRLMQAFKV